MKKVNVKVIKEKNLSEIFEFIDKSLNEQKPYEFIQKLNRGEFDEKLFKEKNLITHNNLFFPKFRSIDRFECARNLYESTSDLSEIEATDPRLWNFACLSVYRDYIFADRKVNQDISKDLFYRYYTYSFSSSATNTALNSISRLWWGIHRSIDKSDEKNPYKYSKILFSNSQIFQDITQRGLIFSNSRLTKAMLSFIENKNKKTDITKLISVYILNHIKSFDISFYTQKDFEDLIEDFFDDIITKGLI